MCGGQSISHNPSPAAMVPSSVTTTHARYSPFAICRSSHGRNAAIIASSAASSVCPISKNIARRCAHSVASSCKEAWRILNVGMNR